MKSDLVYSDYGYLEIISRAEGEEARMCAEQGIYPGLGYCHAFWEAKKNVLKEKHDIDWKSPAERNPDVLFD